MKIFRGHYAEGGISSYGAGYTVEGIMGKVHAHYNQRHEFTGFTVEVNSCMVNPGGGVYLKDIATTLQELDIVLTAFSFPAEYVLACIDAGKEMEKLKGEWEYSPISF